MVSWVLCLLLGTLSMYQTVTAEDKAPLPGSSDRLVVSIGKKDFDKFAADLAVENKKADEQDMNLDINQPDSKGRLLLIEAVRSKDLRFVDAMFQYGAYAQVAEHPTATTPLHVAVSNGATDITRLLLAYGANPDAADKTGRTPRQVLQWLASKSPAIAELFAQYDAGGAAAFEDAPGAWTRNKAGNAKDEFWYNAKTGESRWNVPPQCAWQRMDVRGQPAKYINSVTGQETAKTPKALAWRFVHMTGHADVWHNWAVNDTQVDAPHELPVYLLKELKEQKNVRWHNSQSGELSWEDPQYHTHWRKLEDDAGKPFYYNIETAESQYEVPEALAWTKVADETHVGSHYYFNTKTGDSTWEAPSHLSWTKYNTDL